MTLPSIQELEILGFEWDSLEAAWENRLSELADYRKIHGHCNVPFRHNENTKLGRWVSKQRQQYRFYLKGKRSFMTTFRIQELESLGFEWDSRATWEYRLMELVNYHRIHGHYDVPHNYSENAKLGFWVLAQRKQYKLHPKGKKSYLTTLRIQKLESMRFE